MIEQPDFRYLDQPYVKRLLELVRQTPPGPGVHHVVTEHDEWCPVLSGTGYCVCNPRVRYAKHTPPKEQGPVP